MRGLIFLSASLIGLAALLAQSLVDEAKLSCEYLQKVCYFHKTNSSYFGSNDFTCEEDYQLCKMKRK